MRIHRISRRRFLGGAGLTGLFAIALHHPIARFLRTVLRPAAAATVAEPLSDDELKTLRALSDVLIPSAFTAKPSAADDGQATAVELVMRDILHAYARDPEFRAAAAFLDRRSGADHQLRFAALDIERRRRLVERLLQPYTQRTLFSAAHYYLTADGRAVRSVWHSVAKPIMVDFYASSLGWRVVGYSRQPGECSDLVDYQSPVS